MHFYEALTAPLIIFLVIVCPLWMVLNHRAQARRERMGHTTPASPEDQELMARMVALLERMDGRIQSLEKILDAEHPRWRDRL